jgi:hypothetical protein
MRIGKEVGPTSGSIPTAVDRLERRLVEWRARVVALVKEAGSRSTTLVAITTQKEMRVFAKVEIR